VTLPIQSSRRDSSFPFPVYPAMNCRAIFMLPRWGRSVPQRLACSTFCDPVRDQKRIARQFIAGFGSATKQVPSGRLKRNAGLRTIYRTVIFVGVGLTGRSFRYGGYQFVPFRSARVGSQSTHDLSSSAPPHRSGLAQFAHPAPQITVSLLDVYRVNRFHRR